MQALSSSSAASASSAVTPSHSWRTAATKAFVSAYPWLHAASEGLTFAYHLSYLLGAATTHSPVLHALGMQMTRVSGQDMVGG